MPRGTVYHVVDFTFRDGCSADKYIVQLNDPQGNEPFIVCKTTSRQGSKSSRPGCQSQAALFMLTAGHDFFRQDTWLQFLPLYEFAFCDFLQMGMSRKMQEAHRLRSETIGAVVNCASACDDVSNYHRALICRKA